MVSNLKKIAPIKYFIKFLLLLLFDLDWWMINLVWRAKMFTIHSISHPNPNYIE